MGIIKNWRLLKYNIKLFESEKQLDFNPDY